MTYTLALQASAPALLHPTRALLTIEGERVTAVEYRPEPSIASPFDRAGPVGAAWLVDEAAQLCPTCGLAHALAACQALEQLAGIAVPARAAWLRVAAAELERAASHLRTLSAIFGAVGLAHLSGAFAAQADATRATLGALAGDRRGDWLLPGGVSRDLDDAQRDAIEQAAAAALAALFPIADRSISGRMLLARTVDVGVISASAAAQFGLAGPLARAAGLPADPRRNAPYAAYAELRPDALPHEDGDVYARILVLLLEALDALKLVERAAQGLPGGPWRATPPEHLPAGAGEATVEAPRGPLRYRVESDGRQIVAVTARAAPQLDRLLARAVLVGAALDDVPLIIASTDPCDACLAVFSH